MPDGMMSPARLSVGSLAVGLLVLLLKVLAWQMTGSVALFSDALESIVNLVTAGAAFAAIRVAARPADRSHPWGHQKAEYLAAVLEGALIVFAALLILREAAGVLLSGAERALEAPWFGLAINGAATAINLVWARILLRGGRAAGSAALVADGHHLMADVMTSFGVALGIVLAGLSGIWLLDPLLAIAVAINVLWSGWIVIRASLPGLMDAALPPEERAAIRAEIAEVGGGAAQAHDLRTRSDGRVTFIDFHLIVPGDMRVDAAHAICDRIEARLRASRPNASVTIHVEPEHKAKDADAPGDVVLIDPAAPPGS